MVVISINLGLMNMLIIPGLDGSRILFLLLEALRGKPIAREGYVHAAGMILLFALMAFITLRDVIRLF
jgi:regulator of sigma E protease